MKMATLRLFIAIETPADVKSQIGELISNLKEINPDVRWEKAEKLHITLKFLGDTEQVSLPLISSSLQKIAATSEEFTLRYESFGCFPDSRRPSIFWIGVVDAKPALSHLVNAIESSMSQIGFEKETRTFHPHITIGRVKTHRNSADLTRKMESLTFRSQPTTISEIVLVKSELQSSGSVYTILKKFPLHQERV